MSHQSGIQGSADLLKFLSEARSGSSHVRLIKVTIENEQLVVSHHAKVHKSFEDDYDSAMKECLTSADPCYIFYRMDSKNASGYEWLFISFIPDDASVRQKMLYASTRATLKKEFGGTHIKDELTGTTANDISLNGYKKHKRAETAPAPLSSKEEEMLLMKKSQTGVDVGVDTKHQSLQGVAFPISNDAVQALKDLKHGKANYILFSLDIEKELTNLEKVGNTGLENLARVIPGHSGRYCLVKYPHSHEGDHFDSLVFIYSMPSSGCSVKERMLYSSCKNPLIDAIEGIVGSPVTKRIETDEPSEINEEYLRDQLHPQIHLHQMKFDKPKGPPNRGNKRLVKPN